MWLRVFLPSFILAMSVANGVFGQWDGVRGLEEIPEIQREWQLATGETTFSSLRMAQHGIVTLEDGTTIDIEFLYKHDKVGWRLAREWMQAHARSKTIPSDAIVAKRMAARARENAKLAARNARIDHALNFSGGAFADQVRQVALTRAANAFWRDRRHNLAWVPGFVRKDGGYQSGYWMVVLP